MSSRAFGLVRPAWRNFARNLRRYRVLLAALVLIVMVLIAVLGTLLGLQDSVRAKASRYFAGNLAVLGFSGNGSSVINDPEAVERAFSSLRDAGEPVRAWSRRSTYYNPTSVELFFSGYSTRQRRLVGVEWALEGPVLEDFLFIEGGVPQPGDESGILISTATARDLGIRVGDPVLVSITTDRRRSNTTELIVRGIYSETSFFGYTGYMHRRALNRLREAPEDLVNEMGVYLERSGPAQEIASAAALTEALVAAGLQTFPVISSRAEYSAASGAPRSQLEYGVVPVGAQLQEITDLLAAITIVAATVIVLFLGIVVVGVSNTWTMVVWERTAEIGTLRALGLQRTGTVELFLLEAMFLGLIGVILGSVLGVGLLAGIGAWVEFPPNAATTLFLTRGHLAWYLPWWAFAATAVLAVSAGLFGALRAAVRAGAIHPVEALRRAK